MADRVLIDMRRMKELREQFEVKENEDGQNELTIRKEKSNEMQTTLNNYDGDGLEEWELFKKKFENDLTEQHESLINLIIKTSSNLNSNNSIQSFVKR